MSAIPGVRFDITGASGSQGLLGPKSSYRIYILPRGGYAAQSSTGTLVTFDSAAIAGRFAANNWIQAGLNTANIRQVAAVGGNSLSVSGSALTIAENDYIYLIGNTQPTVTGGSATYTIPQSVIRQRDDDAADLYTNSMVTTNSEGLMQFFSTPAVYDAIIQDGNQANQGSIIALPVGVAEGLSTNQVTTFGATVTINAHLGVSDMTVGSSAVFNGAAGFTGVATFGVTVTFNGAIGVTGTATFGSTITGHANMGLTGSLVTTGGVTFGGGAYIVGGLTLSTGLFNATSQCRVLLYASSTSIVTAGSGTSTTIRWDSEEFDVGNLHVNGTTGSRISIPTGAGGVYLLHFNVVGQSAGGAGGSSAHAYINKNTALTIAEVAQAIPGTGSPVPHANISCIDVAIAGDFYEAAIRYTDAGYSIAGNTRGKSHFSAVKLC